MCVQVTILAYNLRKLFVMSHTYGSQRKHIFGEALHLQGSHGIRNLDVNFSRQGKHGEFSKFNFFTQGALWKHGENLENREFFLKILL